MIYAGVSDFGFGCTVDRTSQCQTSKVALTSQSDSNPLCIGHQDSGGSLEVSLAFKAACPSLQVYVGNDRAASEVLRRGLDGSVTGAGNAVPGSFVAIHRGFVAGDDEQMAKAQRMLNEWAEAREAITPLEVSCNQPSCSGSGSRLLPRPLLNFDVYAVIYHYLITNKPPIIKAGVSLQVQAFGKYVRPPFSDLEEDHAKTVDRWFKAHSGFL